MNQITHKAQNTKQADEALDNPELAAYGLTNKHKDAQKQEEETLIDHTKYLLYNVTDAAREKSHYATDAVKEKTL